MEEQYKQLSQQHSQIKEIENQVSQYFKGMHNLLYWFIKILNSKITGTL